MNYDPVAGTAPASWRVATIGEICDEGGGVVQTGPFGSQLHASDYVPVGIPTVMPKDLRGDRVSTEDIARIRPEDVARLSKHKLRPGDIVYSRRGDVERRALVSDRETGWLCGTGCLNVRVGHEAVDPRFFFYFLGHPSIRSWVVRHAQGATMPNLNTSILRAVPLVLPPRPEQRRIAAVLGALDDKIELNRKMNTTLEEMAQAIFKSWFIDFNGHTDLVDSELGPIPRGWEARPIGDVLRLAYGKSLPKKKRAGGDVPVYGSGGVCGYHNEHLVEGPGIVVGRKGSVGTVFWEDHCFFPIDTTFYVTTTEGTEWLHWAYYQLDAIDILRLSADSAVPGVNRNALLGQKAAIPQAGTVHRFHDVLQPLQAKQTANSRQSQTLAELRDTLLPKLISGELRVPEAEDVVSSTVEG